MTIEEMKACYTLIWDFRAEMGGRWPVPEPFQDSLRFAQTEIAEAQDAWLRLKPEYKRNHSKHVSVVEEVGHCALMLLTALGPGFDWSDPKVEKPWVYWQESYGVASRNGYRGNQVDWVSHLVSDALQEALWDKDEMLRGDDGWYFTEFNALQALVCIGQMGEVIESGGLLTGLQAELEKIKKKHAK